MKKVIEHLEQQLSIMTLNYNTYTAGMEQGDKNLPIESMKRLEDEISEYAQAIKVLTKHQSK